MGRPFDSAKRKGEKRPRNYREHIAQRSLIDWAKMNKFNYPGIHLLYKNTNEGHRPEKQVVRFKKEGLQNGVPDLFLPVARGGYHGLYIEMKALSNKITKIPESQEWWLKELNAQGYLAKICHGTENAINLIKYYYGLSATNNHSGLQRKACNVGQRKSGEVH